MPSINNLFEELAEKVHARYVKTVPFIVSGTRVNPFEPNKRMEWLLQTPESAFDFETKRVKEFDYGEEVLEIYSATEDTVFKRLNRSLFENGLLKPYNNAAPELDTANFLSDAEIAEIAKITTIPAMRARLATLTSRVAVERIREYAKEIDRSVRIIEIIDARIAELV